MLAELLKLAPALIDFVIAEWRKHDDSTQTQLAAALAEATTTLTHLALTEPTSEGPQSFEIRARGVVAVQLGQLGYDVDRLPLTVAMLRDAAVYSARALFERRTTTP